MDSLAAPTAPGHSLPKERRFRSTTSSSSSSRRIPSPSHGRGYEVFLSFRGPDTRKVFADFLYLSLKDAGVDAFRDSDELHVGEDIGPELLDRIERSKISIPIFSENYASSKWCLREIACTRHFTFSFFSFNYKEGLGSPSVQAIRLDISPLELEDRQFTDQNFRNMSGLRFLQIDYADLDGNFRSLLTKLRYLRWRHSKLVCKPANFGLTSLVVLDLSDSKVTHNWEGWRSMQIGSKLKVLILHHCQCLARTPDFSSFPNLEVLILKESWGLQVINPSIGCLTSLLSLDMDFCYSIEKLPPQICFLKSLEVFSARNCYRLRKLEGIEKLEALKELNLRGCEGIEKLPNLSCLRVLRKLDVSGCHKLERLEGLEGLVALEELFVQGCELIEKLPNLSNLRALRKLDVSHCDELEGLEGLDELVALEELSIEGCNETLKLPNLSNLKALIHMTMGECGILEEPEEVCGHRFKVDLAYFFMEKETAMSGFNVRREKLRELAGLDELLALQVLSIKQCTEIEKLPNLSNLKALRQMHVEKCGKLRELEGLHGLVALEKLFADGCKKLREFEGLDELVALQVWSIKRCTGIERLPNLLKFKELRKLRVNGCKNLQGFEGPNGLVALDVLYIDGCKEIEKLNLSNLKLLREFSAIGCKKLRELRGLEELKALTVLVITESVGIEQLPNLSRLKHLRYLRVCSCPNLVEIHALDELEGLKLLEISGCEAIQKLPNLQSLKSLENLVLEGCNELQELEGVDELNNLVELNMAGCREIKKLPTLSRLDKLEELDCEGCENLPKAWRVEAVERMKRNGWESFSEAILLNGWESFSEKLHHSSISGAKFLFGKIIGLALVPSLNSARSSSFPSIYPKERCKLCNRIWYIVSAGNFKSAGYLVLLLKLPKAVLGSRTGLLLQIVT
ncbi:hypothetical protein CDL15_Pgr024613 [Punica granatum]|uniref:TIR domain-containing protein n=1 Tax=Punica granatum TaxID=22663 RepID=A0A218W7G5_PUNGR|nr:hypothetical protein CDL15_Pgr024613 [Punica granatum]